MAVLPLAIANGDVFGLSATGWTYMLVLTALSGLAANGLMVFAQKSIQIGTIAIAQVGAAGARGAVVVLLLGETLRGGQVVGITVAMGGLLAFILINQRGERARLGAERSPTAAGS